jgi:hypothetical protein
MKSKIKFLLATTVAGLAIGVLAPTLAEANNAQIKVTHAVHQDTGAQAAAASAKSDAAAKKFRVAVVASPHAATPSPVNSASPKYIRR